MAAGVELQVRQPPEVEGRHIISASCLELDQQFLGETDRQSKFELYEDLVALATEPPAGVWGPGAIVVRLRPEGDLQLGSVEDASASGRFLLRGDEAPSLAPGESD
jgi:hypothetical protein